MFGGDRDESTVCAVSTPFGYGGISVIRVSGRETLSIVKKIAPFLPLKPESHKAYFGTLHDPINGEIDEVLATYFAHGKSFTGEEVIEISCHGNPLICENVLKSLRDAGAIPALPGEFTYRAFMNGRMDLTQAESVISLVHSRSERASKVSLRHLKGDLSKKLEWVESDLLWVLAHSEAQIDFSSDMIDAANESVIKGRVEKIFTAVEELCRSYDVGKIVSEGLKVALVGKPNAGKSSLYNFLVQKDKAIVSDIPGTTRDLLETSLNFQGLQINLVDTAGLRSGVSDQIEEIGIQKTLSEMNDVDVILWLHDLTTPFTEIDSRHKNLDKVIFIGTKKDLVDKTAITAFKSKLENDGIDLKNERFIPLSVRDTADREKLLKTLSDIYSPDLANDGVYIIHQRQHDHLKEIQSSLKSALGSIETGVGYEFVSFELKRALVNVQETLGKVFDDQILDKVFKEFCIGK